MTDSGTIRGMAEIHHLLARPYYDLKPFVPRSLRWAMRRRLAAGTRRRHQDSWPIDAAAGRIPEGWPGWPDGARFAFVLTHDVEGPQGVARVGRLAALEREAGFRSSFNFIPRGGYEVPALLREELVGRGFEVGVHDLHHDGKLFRSRRGFRRRAGEINRFLRDWDAAGFRSGFMMRQPEWLHDLDIEYDASTFDTDPFEPQAGGCGTIFPYLVRNGAGEGYVELPYTLPQDSTLFLLLRHDSPETWLRKLDWIAEHGGLALVNIHPDYVRFGGEDDCRFRYPVDHVRALLDHVRDRYRGTCWNPVARELASWFRSASCQAR